MTATHQLCLATERSCQLLSSSFPCPCPCAVLVCCESYKFHERVQLDAITHNELMDQEQLAKVGCRGWRGGVGWGGWESSRQGGHWIDSSERHTWALADAIPTLAAAVRCLRQRTFSTSPSPPPPAAGAGPAGRACAGGVAGGAKGAAAQPGLRPHARGCVLVVGS